MKYILLTSALSGSLALYPLGLHAQTYDTWTLGREVLNSAANYTGTLTTAHREVRKYITLDWNTALSEAEQQARTDDLAEITAGQKINTERFNNIVSILNWDVLSSYDVRFRYCDNMLLSYFEGTDFKHGLSAQQMIDAPVLRAQRAGKTFNREQLGRVVDDPTVDDPTEGGVMMLQTNGDSTPIPACMGTEYDGALAEGTVAYMTSATRKLGPREDLSPRTETRPEVCPTGYTDGPKTLIQAREVERNWRFTDSPYLQDFPALRDAVAEIDGPWEDSDDRCYSLVTTPNPKIERGCPPGYSGERLKESEMTEPGRDYRSAAKRDIPPTYGEPYTVSNTCRYVPQPPKPNPCAGIYSEKALDRCHANNGSNNQGGGGGRQGGGGNNHDSGSSDVDGDGYGDYKDFDSRGFGGKSVSGGCGACNGPSAGPTGGDGGNGGGRGRVICTELWRQGLVSRELAVMDLRLTAERLTPAHYRGYHAWAIPVVHKMRQSTRWTAVWKLLAVARMNEIAWQLGKADSPDYLGKIVRHTLEPLSYIIGLFVGESDIAAFERKARNRKEIPHV